MIATRICRINERHAMSLNLRLAALGLTGLLATTPVLADDSLPRRKSGLWEMTMQMPDMPGGGGMKSSQCIDEKTDEAMQKKAMSGGERGGETCRQTSLKRSGNTLDMVADCSGAEGKSHIVSHYTGDMQGSYGGESVITFDPPRHGRKEMRMGMQAKYAGACPADMKPGDIRTGGMTLNPSQPGGAMPGMPDMSKLHNMSPEERKQMMEQMRNLMPKTQ
jgi:hypothetical protein